MYICDFHVLGQISRTSRFECFSEVNFLGAPITHTLRFIGVNMELYVNSARGASLVEPIT